MIRAVLMASVALAGASVTGQALAQGFAAKCESIKGMTIPASVTRLPVGPVTIESAAVATIPKIMGAAAPTAEYCKVTGAMAPRDPKAWPIRFQINLPADWNCRAVQYGGGGYNGVLITGLDQLRDSPPDLPPPLARGFATWGTDSGHQNEKLPALQAFALNDEALENFAHAAYKKVRDLGVHVARGFYGRAPQRLYFFGGSEGGREGLTMAQRYPADFNAIVSVVPVINWVGLQYAGTRLGLVQMDGGWLSPAKVKTLHNAVLAACDTLDAAKDGIVSKPDACRAAFDPRSLRCAEGKDGGDSCLSDAQILTVETGRKRFEFPFPLANGVRSYPGYNYGGEDQPDGMVVWQTGPKGAPAYPPAPIGDTSRIWVYGEGAMRYFIARDPSKHPRDITPLAYREGVLRISRLMDSTNPDLSAFQQAGGKLILKENLADIAQSANAGIEYYQSVVARMGQRRVDRFVRFYTTPGASHSGAGITAMNGSALPRGVDLLGALDAWSMSGKAPGDLVQTAKELKPPFTQTASRPMCRYPALPVYSGTGPLTEAASFVCTRD